MRQLPLRLPLTASYLENAPELASLAILDVALAACEASLLAANLELFHGQLHGSPRNSPAMRAHTLIVQARRLATALAAYREAVDRGRGQLRQPRGQRRQRDQLGGAGGLPRRTQAR